MLSPTVAPARRGGAGASQLQHKPTISGTATNACHAGPLNCLPTVQNNHTFSSEIDLSLNSARPVRIDCHKHVHSNPLLQRTTHLA
jgi:hypothetical protein